MIKAKGGFWIELIILHALIATVIAGQFRGIGDFLFSESFNMRDGSIYWALVIGYICGITLFYGNVYWLLPKYLSKGKYKQYAAYFILFVGTCTGLEYFVDGLMMKLYNLPENLDNLFDFSKPFNRRDIGGPVWVINLAILTLSSLYRFAKDWIVNERIKSKLTEEKLKAELNFLKSQINPHFLFNTLNNIFSIARKNKDIEAADSIAKLSNVLRYMLYESNVPLIPLQQEINAIESLIEIQKLRSEENDVIVNFTVTGTPNSVQIPPMLLVPLVENAFKHGINTNGNSIIRMELKATQSEVRFVVENKIYKTNMGNREDWGIGLKNVRRRLDLMYPGRHQFNIVDVNSDFIVTLILKLS